MSDQQDVPSGSSDNVEKSRPSSQSQPVPASTGGAPRYVTEPIQFRVRGSSTTGASPPKFVSLEEIMTAAHGFKNMALAHEIAVDQDFKLEPFEPPDNSYQKLVKDTLHRAYFDILREQLNSDPPVYKQALVLLEDVKQGLFSLLLPRHTRIKQVIEEVLDSDFIKQQAENNSLDFGKYAAFVIDLMAKLAAPARDEMIQDITKLEDTVDIFRSILETLEVLKLDMANTLVAMIRPHVQAESVQYERNKFKEMLKVSEDGLQYTREWLTRHIDKTDLVLPVTDQTAIRNITAQTLAKAYLELLEWDDSKNYPETVTLDAARFLELGLQIYRMVAVSAVLLVSPSCSADQAAAAQLKHELKEKIYIIMGDACTDTQLNKVLPSIAEEVIRGTEQLLEKFNQGPLASDVKELIRTQITGLRDPDHRVRQIVRQRVLEFLKGILVCGGGSKQVPVGLSALSQELTSIAGTLLRYVMHNKAVFTEHYLDIVTEELSKTS
ncbi:T-complex protein 11-like protein 1 isoform X2 [Plutella xylostella]|uniref:T-complex protein 11-like protein 1 isoform X1 n=1 Tax=Plutella xylostella TaxID=51655 RepID=UPI0020327D83|nr:T-complex protein 11-like protein 1 isoform X1 [Plutella xylostella]XP_048481274.1 T-complex protein 11-like protein 1 isoform X2 [Plutella xylostella]